MKAAESYALAQKIIKKCDGSRDPEVIYQCLGIELEDTFDLANLKGMYSSADRHRTIYLHKRLTGYLRRFVLMHEICHDQIPEHRKRARRMPYKEIQFFGGVNQSEREANSVAAHVLIDDEKMVKVTNPHFKWGFDFNPSGVVPGFRQRRSFAVPFLLVAF